MDINNVTLLDQEHITKLSFEEFCESITLREYEKICKIMNFYSYQAEKEDYLKVFFRYFKKIAEAHDDDFLTSIQIFTDVNFKNIEMKESGEYESKKIT